ncbi:hypothetical protein ABZP36_025090 [Zizania latifolia]
MDPEKRGYRFQEFVAHDAEVRSLSIGKKSSRVFITGGSDRKVNLWAIGKQTPLLIAAESITYTPIVFPYAITTMLLSSADRTVKFWDLETFELIGSAGPEVTGVRSMVFHPDGKTLFCGLDQSLKVFSWEPVRCHDVVDMGWSNLADLSIYEGKLLGCSYHESHVGVWVADISLIGPYALGVLPKANFFAELVHSLDDNPTKLIDSTAKSIPAQATAHPKNLYKVKESGTVAENGIQGSHLTGASIDKIKKDKSSTTPRRPDSSFKSSIQSSTPVRRMKVVDSPSTNQKTTERNFGQRDVSLASHTGIANCSSTVKKGGLSGLKFSFGLTPYFKKEKSNNTDKGDIAQMAERLDKTVSLEHQLQSNDASESPCSTTETARVKYVRGVAVPLGKTKSLVERWEKREATNVECSPPTSSCGDRAMRSDGPSSFSAEPSQTYEKDLSTVDEAMTLISLMQNHDEFINAVKSRLTKLEMMRHVFDQNGIKGATAAVAKLPDNAVQADVVSTLKGKLDLFNLEIFSSFLPVLAGLLSSRTERHAIVSLEMLLDLIKIFGPVIHSTLSAHSAVGVDIQAEQRLQRCSRCFNHLQKIQQVLHPLIMRGGQSAQLAQELNLSLQDLVVI